jgi:hypothetical protein
LMLRLCTDASFYGELSPVGDRLDSKFDGFHSDGGR